MNTIDIQTRGDGPRRRRRPGSDNPVRTTAPRRTTLHEDDMHVATIVEYVDDTREGRGFCLWYVAGTAGHADDYAGADRQIREELVR